MKAKALTLLALLLFAASACTTNTTVIVSVQQPALTGANCKLQRELRTQDQKTDFWCWAASAHTVIEYVKNEPVEQCTLVDAVFRSRLDAAWEHHIGKYPGDTILTRPNCCMSTEPTSAPDSATPAPVSSAPAAAAPAPAREQRSPRGQGGGGGSLGHSTQRRDSNKYLLEKWLAGICL